MSSLAGQLVLRARDKSGRTGQRSVRSWAVHGELRAGVRAKIPASNGRLGTSLVPDLKHVRRLREGRCARLLFPLPGVPHNLRRIAWQNIAGGCCRSDRVGVAVGGTRSDDRQRRGSDAEHISE